MKIISYSVRKIHRKLTNIWTIEKHEGENIFNLIVYLTKSVNISVLFSQIIGTFRAQNSSLILIPLFS